MAITNWTSEGMDWSGDLSGRLLTPYIKALAMAAWERAETCLWPWASGDEYTRLEDFVTQTMDDHVPRYQNYAGTGTDLIGIAQCIEWAIQGTISNTLTEVGGNYLVQHACNFNDNGGAWDGHSGDRFETCTKWTWTTILADIGDPARLLVSDNGYISADWLKQKYELLNRLKWFTAYHGSGAADGGGWNVTDYPTFFNSEDAVITNRRPDLATAKSDASSLYASSTPSYYGGSPATGDPLQYTNIIYEPVQANPYRVELWSQMTSLSPYFQTSHACTVECYAHVAAVNVAETEFDVQRSSHIFTEGKYNLWATTNIATTDPKIPGDYTIPSYISDNILEPLNYNTTTITAQGNYYRGWQAWGPVVLRKYDVTDGYQFV